VPNLQRIEPGPPEGDVEIALVVSRYNQWITDRLRDGAIDALARVRPEHARVTEIPAPGTFELPTLARAAADTGRFHAIVCLGCVIKGETEHDRYIAGAVAGALAAISTGDGAGPAMAVAFGIITANNAEQAEARAGGSHGNKGAEAMEAALASLGVIRRLNQASWEESR
jgi:6,7-dimethyl-8-ribityllumazine synthase